MTILTKPSLGAKPNTDTDVTVVVENGSILDQVNIFFFKFCFFLFASLHITINYNVRIVFLWNSIELWSHSFLSMHQQLFIDELDVIDWIFISLLFFLSYRMIKFKSKYSIRVQRALCMSHQIKCFSSEYNFTV